MDDSDRTAMLFREYHERLTRFARHLVGAGADADDLVQETFLKAHHYLCSGNDIRAPMSFLFVTMRNLVNDAGRQKKIAMMEVPLEGDEIAPDEESPSVERQVMSEREFERLCAAIADLPERMRDAFVLRKVYGYSCREIAEHLGRSSNTVREQVVQSFKKLHALRTSDGFLQHEARSCTSARPEHPKTNDSDHVRPFSLTPVARREPSG